MIHYHFKGVSETYYNGNYLVTMYTN